jgi:predicted flap endonuclease-1-like 5' DNA nuclease
MNWQGVSADLPVALILMIGAAILGGLIIWIIKQWGYRSLKAEYDQKVGEYGELSNQHSLLSTRHDDITTKYNELNAKFLELQEKHNVQTRQLKECSAKRLSLEEEVSILTPFRKKYEDLQPQYDAAKLKIEGLEGEVNSLTVRNTGLQDALKDERKENMYLKNSLSLLHGLQTKYDDSQKEIEELKAKITELEAAASATPEITPLTSGGKETEADILARIEEKAKNIDFGRIGIATIDDKDDLKIIKGIGPFIEKKLNALKIFTFRQIANFTEEDEEKVTDAIEFFPGRIRRDEWVYQAKNLLNLTDDKEQATLERIKARAAEINFDRIGVATIADKDDLKLIKGIGPFIEKKLHSIGIYTFAQIARFTTEDEEKVNEVIEFFPGRIRRDGWQSQANSFVEEED